MAGETNPQLEQIPKHIVLRLNGPKRQVTSSEIWSVPI